MKKLPTISATFFLATLLFFSCTEKDNRQIDLHKLRILETQGSQVNKDSIPKLVVIPVDDKKLKIVAAGKPKVVAANQNVHSLAEAKVFEADQPIINTPGKDSFLLPTVVPAIDSAFVAGIPQRVLAKEAGAKEKNPQNFSIYSKLQGLKHNDVLAITEDREGNLWFGTVGGGVTKYDGKYFSYYTTKEGLATNECSGILQDKKGNIWISSSEGGGAGVSRLDGKNITLFSEKEGLCSNVTCMLEDRKGNIWFGSNTEGLFKYDGKTFTNFKRKQGLSNDHISSLMADKLGNIWMGNHAISKFDGKSFYNYPVSQFLCGSSVSEILEDQNGNIWFSTNNCGITRFDGKSFSHLSSNEGLTTNEIVSMKLDRAGNLWLGTSGQGIDKLSADKSKDDNFNTVSNYSEKDGLSNNYVMSMLEDKFGNIWFGTYGGGVNKFGGKIFTHYTTGDGLSSNDIMSVLEDRNGNIWLGTNGNGVTKYDGKSFSHFTEKEGLPDNVIFSMLEDKEGNIWFGTLRGGAAKYDGKNFTHYTPKDGLPIPDIRTMMQDKAGNIWFGTAGFGVSKFDGKSFTNFGFGKNYSGRVVFNINEDKQGNIWFATYDGGLTRYDGNNFRHFGEKDGLPSLPILGMYTDASGNIWFTSLGEGILKYDGKRFVSLKDKEGLLGNFLSKIVEDKSGNIWFGNRFGISELSKNSMARLNEAIQKGSLKNDVVLFKNYSYEDGFLGVGCNSLNSILCAKNGNLWIGANDRVTVYHPDGDLPDTIAPQIKLTELDLFNENIAWSTLLHNKDTVLTLGNGSRVSNFQFDSVCAWYGLPEQLSLAYNNNHLTFNYVGISQKNTKKIKYTYKLEGNDDSWSALTSKTEVAYANIPNGHYTFKVKAVNSEGYWSDEAGYSFTIRPPWWLTWWFRVLLVGFILFLFYGIYRWRTASLRHDKMVLEQTVKERTVEIVEQKQLIEEKHKEITDSINYAERIQRALLASKQILDDHLNDYFILYQPKAIVSGDFYWAGLLANGNFAMVTADSTGHGVPGAIMSILNMASIDKAITKGINSPDQIFNETRSLIIEHLKNDGSHDGGKDGMDASILSFDFKMKTLYCASAFNPIWIIRGNELMEITPDRMPVGKHALDHIPFNLQTIALQSGDVIYSLTDGFPDQFGGPKLKKFMYKKLKELLLKLAQLPMSQQKKSLETEFKVWKGHLEQVDDVTLIGIRV